MSKLLGELLGEKREIGRVVGELFYDSVGANGVYDVKRIYQIVAVESSSLMAVHANFLASGERKVISPLEHSQDYQVFI